MTTIKKALMVLIYLIVAAMALPIMVFVISGFAVIFGGDVAFWTEVAMFAGDHSVLNLAIKMGM